MNGMAPSKGSSPLLVDATSSMPTTDTPNVDLSSGAALGLASKSTRPARGKKPCSFPKKLFRILEEAEKKDEEDIIGFLPHGRSFEVRDIQRFVADVMPRYFRTGRFSSFLRQLNLYGFRRVSEQDGSYAYHHELFRKDRKAQSQSLKRKSGIEDYTRVDKGTMNEHPDGKILSAPKVLSSPNALIDNAKDVLCHRVPTAYDGCDASCKSADCFIQRPTAPTYSHGSRRAVHSGNVENANKELLKRTQQDSGSLVIPQFKAFVRPSRHHIHLVFQHVIKIHS